MKPETTEDILELMNGNIVSAVLGAAMELGIFWYHLPTGFDLVMLCDVGYFSEILFRRIHDVLNLKGRLVIVDKFAMEYRLDHVRSSKVNEFLSLSLASGTVKRQAELIKRSRPLTNDHFCVQLLSRLS
jgi:hypothetical protein